MRRWIALDRDHRRRGCEHQSFRAGASRFGIGSEVRGSQSWLAVHLRPVDWSLGARSRTRARCAAAGRSDHHSVRGCLADHQRCRWRQHRSRARALCTPGRLTCAPRWRLPVRYAAEYTACEKHVRQWPTGDNSPAPRNVNRNAASGCVTTLFAHCARRNVRHAGKKRA